MDDMRTTALAGALAALFATDAHAALQGSTYDLSVTSTGATTIDILSPTGPGAYTDPANPGLCVGPNADSCGNSGLLGTFSFADQSPTASTITFNFVGGTYDSTGTFTVDLSDIAAPDGSAITDVALASGSLTQGSFSDVTYGASDVSFTWQTTGAYAGDSEPFVFDVTESVPEPASLAMLGSALVSAGLLRRKRRG